MSIDPKRVEKALSAVIKDLDYDLWKDLEAENDDAFGILTRVFTRHYDRDDE